MNAPLSATEIKQQVSRQTFSPAAVVRDCLTQIERMEPQLKAWACVDSDGAMQAAAALEQALNDGKSAGSLCGIPVGVKDIVDVKGLPTRAGSALTAAEAVTEDAPFVKRLRAAGAIILGKTVTTEFACFDPAATFNPWNLERTPGGSSSGSAAAVAAQMCPVAIGSQTGGSVTRPASYCGIASCKPTFGRIDRTGVFPVSEHLDHVGVFGRSVEDLALLLNCVQEEFCDKIPDTFPTSAEGLRIGMPTSYFLDEANDEVRRITLESVSRFAAAGAEVIPVKLPASFAEVHAMHWKIMAYEAAQVHREQYAASPAGYGPKLTGLLNEGLELPVSEYEVALQHQMRFSKEMTASLPPGCMLLTPATPAAAPDRNSTGDPRFNSPWSYAGLPTVSIPCVLDSAGMPLCLQFIGPAWSESELFAVAGWCETQLAFSATPSLLNA